MDVPLLNRALVHHVAWNAEKPHLDVRRGSLLLGNFIHFKSKVPAKHVNAVGLRRVLSRADRSFELRRDLRHVTDTYGSINGADMNHAAAFQSLHPTVTLTCRVVCAL